MTDHFYIVHANANIRHVYGVTPELFQSGGFLIVSIDSNRSPDRMLPIFLARGIAAQKLEDGIWLSPEQAPLVFAANDILVHFDAIYIFANLFPNYLPKFNLTTDVDLSQGGHTQNLLQEMVLAKAVAYFADGCGLFAALKQRSLADTIATRLGGVVDCVTI